MRIRTLHVTFITFLFALAPQSALALSASVHVPEKYTDVLAGERFYFELEILYPENPSRKDLRLTYDVLQNGEVIAQSKFLKAVETQATFMDYLVVPESAEPGLHEIRVTISDYENLHAETAASFQVRSKDNTLLIYFLILFGTIIAFGVFVAIEVRVLARTRG